MRRTFIDKGLVLPLLMLVLFSVFPSSMGKLKFLPIYKTISIKQNKRLPPHIAFLESNFEAHSSEWMELRKQPVNVQRITTEPNAIQGQYLISEKRVLTGVVIRKSVEVLSLGTSSVYKTNAQRVAENQGPAWLDSVVRKPAMIQDVREEQRAPLLSSARRISGPIEITGGLAVTNSHHIEVRRSNDGVFQEMGKVDLLKGTYSIDVEDPSGSIVAKLVNSAGETIGEGSVRISQLNMAASRFVTGPRIALAPSTSWPGSVTRYYPPPKGKTVEPPVVTTFAGENRVDVSKSGDTSFPGLLKNSSTVVRAQAAGHWPSNKLMLAGEKNFRLPLFPNSMMSALKNLSSDSSAFVEDTSENPAIVWGTAKLDGKPISGITVHSESDPEAKAIYFNDFMIPDAKLTATSSNGMFAFTGMNEGFQALLGQRGDAYFSHQNILVEAGTVSVADLESTLHTEPITVRAFDAFTGEAVDSTAQLQSLQGPTVLSGGTANIVLPQIARMSLIYTDVASPYLKGNYFYTDTDAYIHLPMIREDWLTTVRNEEKVNQVVKAGTIVGFVPNESFEVYLAGAIQDKEVVISYFDATGKPTSKGVAGGGFVIFNVPPGFREAVVISDKSDKVLSRVVPVDESSLSVLSFNSY